MKTVVTSKDANFCDNQISTGYYIRGTKYTYLQVGCEKVGSNDQFSQFLVTVHPEDEDKNIQLEGDWQLEMSFRCKEGKTCPADP